MMLLTHLLGYPMVKSADLVGPQPRIALFHRLTEPRTHEGRICNYVHLELR